MLALKVPKKIANEVRKVLIEKSLMNLNLKIKPESDFVFIPLDEKLHDESNLIEIMTDSGFHGFETVDTEFESLKRAPRSMTEYLKDKLNEKEIEDLKKSFDIIGDVVILEIPEELQQHKKIIGEAALKFTKRKAVYMKSSAIKGVIRTREMEHLAGEDVSETIHQEYGCRLLMDVKNVYFSPRLATERRRVADRTVNGEIVLDMFAGVGPFSILIAREKSVKIYAVDINPSAYDYLKRNIELNKVQNKVIPLLGDVADMVSQEKIKADRIIMNLPGTACEFLGVAMDAIKEGGVIHYYEFSSDYDTAIKRLEDAANPRKVEILEKRKVKSRSPGQWHIVVDARVF